jgi:hypothetical protein
MNIHGRKKSLKRQSKLVEEGYKPLSVPEEMRGLPGLTFFPP